MIGIFVRFLFVIGGFIASLFFARDALNFDIIQMVVTVLLFTSIIAIIAFWPIFKDWFKKS